MRFRGYTIETFAEKVNLSSSKLGRILKGAGNNIDVDAFNRIGEQLGMTLSEMLDVSKTANAHLTGFPVVDSLIETFYSYLHRGMTYYHPAKQLTTDDYKLEYLLNGQNQTKRYTKCYNDDLILADVSISLLEEFKQNEIREAKYDQMMSAAIRAWGYGHQTVLVNLKTNEVPKTEGPEPGGNLYDKQIDFSKRSIRSLEAWEIDKTWPEIKSGTVKEVKIARRTIGVVDAWQNS